MFKIALLQFPKETKIKGKRKYLFTKCNNQKKLDTKRDSKKKSEK